MTGRKMMLFVIAAVFCGMLLVGCGGKSSDAAQTQSSSDVITVDEAKVIALNHSGVAEADAHFVRADYERDDNSYEVEFYADNVEYDYEIQAVSGEVLSYDSEIEGFTIGDNTAQSDNGTVLTEEEAKAIALNHAGLSEGDVKGLRVTRDRDDGRDEYEVEFRQGFTEYDYEINAATGEIISYDIDGN